LAEAKAGRGSKIDAATEELKELEEKVKAVDEAIKQLPAKGKTMTASEMVEHAEEVEKPTQETKESVEAMKKTIVDVSAEIEDDVVRTWVTAQAKQLENRLNKSTPVLTKGASAVSKFRADAKKKDSDEMAAVEKKAIRQIKHAQSTKELDSDKMFALIDTKKDKKIDEKEFLAFFAKCDAEKKKAAEKGDSDDEKADEAPDCCTPEELKRLFKQIVEEDDTTSISKEKFASLIRVFMKVVRDTVITDEISIKGAKSLRRLETGEVVELLAGPMTEDSANVKRIQARVMKDDITGWITLSGSQGSVFLEEGGATYKVVKETILTDAFELDGGNSTRKLKDTTRKLQVGETVEVKEFPKKEKTGLMRMKCKATKDGSQGWVTTVGNSGVVFLQMC